MVGGGGAGGGGSGEVGELTAEGVWGGGGEGERGGGEGGGAGARACGDERRGVGFEEGAGPPGTTTVLLLTSYR